MATQAGTHRLGPANALLWVRTGRGGAAAKAGHDLVISVTTWEATLVLGEAAAATSVELTADGTSLRVTRGSGGLQPLGGEDKDNIHQTIDDEVLERQDVKFRSTGAKDAGEGAINVSGDLTIVGTTRPIDFDLVIGEDGMIGASVVVTQSTWGIKPYSALFGALKVSDEVEVVLDGHLQPQSR